MEHPELGTNEISRAVNWNQYGASYDEPNRAEVWGVGGASGAGHERDVPPGQLDPVRGERRRAERGRGVARGRRIRSRAMRQNSLISG